MEEQDPGDAVAPAGNAGMVEDDSYWAVGVGRKREGHGWARRGLRRKVETWRVRVFFYYLGYYHQGVGQGKWLVNRQSFGIGCNSTSGRVRQMGGDLQPDLGREMFDEGL